MPAAPLVTIFGSVNVNFTPFAGHLLLAGETLQAQSFATGCDGKARTKLQHVDALPGCIFAPPSLVVPCLTAATAISIQMVGAVDSDAFGS